MHWCITHKTGGGNTAGFFPNAYTSCSYYLKVAFPTIKLLFESGIYSKKYGSKYVVFHTFSCPLWWTLTLCPYMVASTWCFTHFLAPLWWTLMFCPYMVASTWCFTHFLVPLWWTLTLCPYSEVSLTQKLSVGMV